MISKIIARVGACFTAGVLVGVIVFCKGFEQGHLLGYAEAMADVILKLETPESFLLRMFQTKDEK